MNILYVVVVYTYTFAYVEWISKHTLQLLKYAEIQVLKCGPTTLSYCYRILTI